MEQLKPGFRAMLKHLQGLLKADYLNEEAKDDVRFMLKLHSSGDYRMDDRTSLGLMYLFLANSQSQAGLALRAALKGYSGDLLTDATSAHKAGLPITSAFKEGGFKRASDWLARPLGSCDFLNALIIFPNSDNYKPIFDGLRDRRPIEGRDVIPSDSNLARFLADRGLNLNDLATRLGGYGQPEDDPDSIISRFSLGIRLLPSGQIKAEIVERWGKHKIAEHESVIAGVHGLWLPETVLFLPSEVEAFDRLLNAKTPSSETAFQEFFEVHPKWLYLLGEQYESFRPQVSLPALQVSAELALVDGPVDRMELRPDFLLKRIGLDIWDVLDIKRADFQTAVGSASRRKLSEVVADAVAQLREYARRLRQNEVRAHLRREYKISLAEPIAMVVIGRDSGFKTLYEKVLLQSSDSIRVYTYDDLRRLARHRLLRV